MLVKFSVLALMTEVEANRLRASDLRTGGPTDTVNYRNSFAASEQKAIQNELLLTKIFKYCFFSSDYW